MSGVFDKKLSGVNVGREGVEYLMSTCDGGDEDRRNHEYVASGRTLCRTSLDDFGVPSTKDRGIRRGLYHYKTSTRYFTIRTGTAWATAGGQLQEEQIVNMVWIDTLLSRLHVLFSKEARGIVASLQSALLRSSTQYRATTRDSATDRNAFELLFHL